jgi:DNA-binding CsgD family transcriptional regulator
MDGDRLSARATRAFVGRQRELAALAAALAAVGEGEPRVVFIEGDAGIGKSSLIREFLGGQHRGSVVTASGDEAEALLPYGLVQQLAAAVPGDAVAGLQLLCEGPRADADPLAVGAELLALISSMQESEPVVVVIEDMQWIDLASARALLFCFRRLSADRVLMLLTCKTGGLSLLSAGWERFASGDRRAIRLTLGGLDADEMGLLCQAMGRTGLSDRARQRLTEHTGGSPPLARALLAELPDEALNAQGGSLRAPRSLAEVIRSRLARLPQPTRDLVAAASVLGDHCTLGDAAAVARMTASAAVLGEAEQAEFLLEQETPTGWRISFVHPLVRQAVYDDLGAQQRRALHRRAAAVVGSEDSLAHRYAAAVGADRELASDLDEAAGRAARAGKLRLAARYEQQAAVVTCGEAERDERTLTSFELLIRAADVAQAEAARPAVERLAASARRDAALGLLAVLAARPLDAQTLLRAAWDAHDPVTEASEGREAALGLGILLGISGSFTEADTWLERALSGATGNEPWYDAARSLRAVPLALSGEGARALRLFRDLPERAAMVPTANTDSITYRGLVKLWTGDLPGAIDDLATAANRIRAGLQVRFPGQPLAYLAEAEFRRGRWDDSQDHAELAVSLAHDADRHYDLAFVHSAAARVPACRGDWAVAASHVEAAEDAARTLGGIAAIFAASARSILGLARDDPAEVLRAAAAALAVPEIDYYDDPAAFWWRPLQIWALIRTGRLGEAETVLAAFKSRAADRRESLALINAAWLGGSLAMARGELKRADQALREGCRASGAGLFPFHYGLVSLEHGRCLARMHQRRAATVAIRAGNDAFTGLLARPFTEAARSELAALGVRPRGGGESDLPGLTVQELRVARLVASGLSNREAAAQLYLSPRTVEYHLASVFTKLGVGSRHQLAARFRGRAGHGIATQ